MPWHKVTHKNGEIQFIASGVEDYRKDPDWTVGPARSEPTEDDSIEAALDTPEKAEIHALCVLSTEAELASESGIGGLRRQLAIDRTWQEIQMLKLAKSINSIPDKLDEQQRKMFPTLSGYVDLCGGARRQAMGTGTQHGRD